MNATQTNTCAMRDHLPLKQYEGVVVMGHPENTETLTVWAKDEDEAQVLLLEQSYWNGDEDPTDIVLDIECISDAHHPPMNAPDRIAYLPAIYGAPLTIGPGHPAYPLCVAYADSDQQMLRSRLERAKDENQALRDELSRMESQLRGLLADIERNKNEVGRW